MKSIISLIAVLIFHVTAYSQSFRLEPIPSVTIPVTVYKMTNLVFPEAIQPAVKVSAEIIAQKVHGIENVIEVKALLRHFTTTNLTAYGKDGRLYSFVLKYVDDTSILNFRIRPDSASIIQLTDLPTSVSTIRQDARLLEAQPRKLHCATHTDHLALRLTGIYSKDSLEWLTFRMTNHSSLDFHPETIRFYLQDRRKVRRRAIQEVDIPPVYQDDPPIIAHRQRSSLAVAFNPFHISKGKRLICEFRGKDGRILLVKLSRRPANRPFGDPS